MNLLFFQFLNANTQTYFCYLEDSLISDIWIGQQTIDSGLAHSGYLISVTDSLNPYGLGMEMNFPEEKRGMNTMVTIEGWVKSSASFPKATFVVTITEEGKELFWESVRLDTVRTANIWNEFSATYKIPASVTKNAVFKCFLWNIQQKDTVVIDDLKVEFKYFSTPSFLPAYDKAALSESTSSVANELLFTNPFYSIRLDKKTKEIVFVSKSGESIAGHFMAIDQLIIGEDSIEQTSALIFKGKQTKNGITELRLKSRSKAAATNLIIHCDLFSPQLKFEVEEKYRKHVICKRSAILLQVDQPVTEVMRANRKSDTNDFQQEYWLDKQGALFGENNNTLYVYHTPGISSLQLDLEHNRLWINLDYEKDHPFLHFPLRNDTIDFKEDWSAGKFKKGSKRTNHFKLTIGAAVASLPRFMKNSSGYIATYIWTEHADFSNIQTNRATYFGSEEITEPDEANGGFVFYNIPVTKSVFYDNPDQITNAEISGGKFTGFESAIKTDTAFLRILNQMNKQEIEICLHTPEQFTTTPDQLEAALNYTKIHFDAVSWIDHGYNNLPHNNREDFMCDGLLNKSPFYAAVQWKRYGVKYFWNAYYEDYFTFEKWRFGSSLEPYFSGFGDFMPKPGYWRHPTRSGDFIHWPTSTVLYVEHDALWDYFFNDHNLNAFIENWSVEMNHCYPAWVDPKKGFWTYDADSTIVAQLGFNRTLEKMASLKKEGRLNVTTVKEFIDYQLLLENIDYQLLSDGRIRVTNSNPQDVKGLSFATKAKAVLVDRLKPEQKVSVDDLIFWFDLKAGESRVIRVID
ncbi:MAG: hypothetical protein KQH67_01990 [Bacteroidetes bacterium]|nr:hypothetical protein [Bacteroidota bacterium]